TQSGSDALSPPPSAPLPQVLKTASKDMIVHVWPRGAAFALSVEAGIHAYFADCDEILPVGASGLGTAIARRFAQTLSSRILSPNPTISQRAKKPILFVIG